MIKTDGYDPNDPRDNPPDMTSKKTPEDHAVAIAEAVERVARPHERGGPIIDLDPAATFKRERAEARAALADAIRAALESPRAPTGNDGAFIEAGKPMAGVHDQVTVRTPGPTSTPPPAVISDVGMTLILSERSAIVAWLRRHPALDALSAADAIGRGEHRKQRECMCFCGLNPNDPMLRARSRPGPHHDPSCPMREEWPDYQEPTL